MVVTRNEITLQFPTSLTFELEATAPGEVKQVTLIYGTDSTGCLQGMSRVLVGRESGNQLTIAWEWDFKQGGSIPPGANIWWEWEIILADGSTLTIDRQNFAYEDPRFTWKQTSDSRISVYWTEGTSAFGNTILTVAQNSLKRIEENLGIQTENPIRITVYPSPEDIKGAILYVSDWIGGLAFPEFYNLMVAIPPDYVEYANDYIPHEIAHLIVRARTFNCLGISLPTWLSEGLSVAAEGDQSEAEQQLLVDQLEAGTLPGLNTLASGFSANSDEAHLAYTYSGAIIFYLVDTYGPEKLDELLGVMQSGKNANPALLQVYGLDTAGIDRAWRLSLGYESGPTQAATTSQSQATSIPTLALWTAVVALSPTPTPAPTDIPSPTPAPATPTPTHAPDTPAAENTLSPTPTPEQAKPKNCLGGFTLGILYPFGFLLIFRFVNQALRSRFPGSTT